MGGQHLITANYGGDDSYLTGSGSYPLTVNPAGTTLSTGSPFTTIAGSSLTFTANVYAYLGGGFAGVAPTGTITFADGAAKIPGTVTYGYQGGFSPSIVGSISDTFTTTGPHQITMNYSGDANYAASSSSTSVAVFYSTTTTENANTMTINDGKSVTVTAVAKSATKTPAMTGSFFFTGDPFFSPVTITPTLSTDGSGNQVLTATTTITPQQFGSQTITANYLGDSNYESGFASLSVTVNPPDFTLGTSVPSLTITAGQSGSASVTATPQSSLSSPVSLVCNLSPIVGATCSFSPSSQLNLSNGMAASATMTITTIAPSSSPTTQFTVPKPPRRVKAPPPGQWLFVAVDALAILILSLWSGKRYRRLAASLGMVCMLFLAVGCGSSGGGSGGGGGPVPTTLTLTASAVKVPSGTTVTMTVTVHSTQPVTGVVNLGEPGLQYGPATVINGTATFQLQNLPVGVHVIGAAYSGDANNNGSQTSGTVAVVVTGTAQITVSGVIGTLTHTMPISVTIQ